MRYADNKNRSKKAADVLREMNPQTPRELIIEKLRIDKGYVQEYPCDCSEGSVCYIVRHPLVSPPMSFPTKKEAEDF